MNPLKFIVLENEQYYLERLDKINKVKNAKNIFKKQQI